MTGGGTQCKLCASWLILLQCSTETEDAKSERNAATPIARQLGAFNGCDVRVKDCNLHGRLPIKHSSIYFNIPATACAPATSNPPCTPTDSVGALSQQPLRSRVGFTQSNNHIVHMQKLSTIRVSFARFMFRWMRF